MQILDGRLVFSASDVNNFLECAHLTKLDWERVYAGRPIDERSDHVELVARKGQEHEAAYLAALRSAGMHIETIANGPGLAALESAARATEAAMRTGAPVIYQAAFFDDAWRGYADFLLRVERPSRLGAWSYEVADTKLALHTKPYFLIQLCFYSELLAKVQGLSPEFVHVVLGSHEQQRYRTDDFSAYYRRVKARFAEHVAAGSFATYPLPVAHCEICRWLTTCAAQRYADDHLSLVAGMRRDQIARLEAGGVTTLAALASAPRVSSIAVDTFNTIAQQARLQHAYRASGEHHYELLAPQPALGFAQMPAASPGDIFFDMEGDPFYWEHDPRGPRGLEYLFGAVVIEAGAPVFHRFWGTDRAGERTAFESFIDFVVERRRRYPDLHVYHYASYEPTKLKVLMGRHATREDELDDLLRGEVFVDLYRVVRQSLRISQPSYSIKKLEVFYRANARSGEVTAALDSVLAFERWLLSGDDAELHAIEAYNKDDCVSTWELRAWLLERRAEAQVQFGVEIPFGPPAADEGEKGAPSDENAELAAALVRTMPMLAEALTADDRGRALLALLLDYHRREAKPTWWAFFDRCKQTPEELIDDLQAIGDIRPAPGLAPRPVKRSMLVPFTFPPQAHRLITGAEVSDPATRKRAGAIGEVDDASGIVWLLRGPSLHNVDPPRALIPGGDIPTTEQREALRRLAREAIANTQPRRHLAAWEMLTKAPTRVRGHVAGAPLQKGHADLDELHGLVAKLEGSYLIVQGPPGSGKTFAGARLILECLRRGKRVGVAANSHKAIDNLLHEIEEAALESGFRFRGWKKSSSANPDSEYVSDLAEPMVENVSDAKRFPGDDTIRLVAGTAWLFTRETMEHDVDYLFIDESGQVALADALGMATAARNVVLLGDPAQLPHVSQGAHPEGTSLSILEHLIGTEAPVAPERGYLLDATWRMHPDICAFISESFYAGKLSARDQCARQRVDAPPFTGSGLRYIGVEHAYNSQDSPEEASALTDAVRALLRGTLVSGDADERVVQERDIMVVAPYNVHVRTLQRHLSDAGYMGVRVGTVDKFQGQEAPIVFFSMATSSGEDLPRNMEFLFSRNRLNVAISRARALAILVASPALFDVRCNDVAQMHMANALCRFVEKAQALPGANRPACR